MNSTQPDPILGSAEGVQRRTIVAGAAWTIPVIATAVGAPLAAASDQPTLTFTNGPYSANGCGTLGDVVIRATTDGTTPVTSGTLISVTLPAGFTWSDGLTGPRAFPADGNGEVAVSGIRVPATATNATLTASTGGLTAAAPVSVTANQSVFAADGSPLGTGQPVGLVGLKGDGANAWGVTSSGDLWLTNGGPWAPIAGGTGVSDYYVNGGGGAYLKDGVVYGAGGAVFGSGQPGTLVSIEGDGANIWGADAAGNLFLSGGGAWLPIAGATGTSDYYVNGGGATYLKNGVVYGADGTVFGSGQPGTLVSIEGDGANIWGADAAGNLFLSGGGAWLPIAGATGASDYYVNGDGGAYLKGAC
ncbi:hypothetical protein [Rathayibacter sp. VKM Ac-2630]|uniref:hypothetical protein n=1 Tax=Rathayibacter sp. VKM Ac-2630 TaxID=1938617 RepID=UPI0009823441|nr:hypothetical protein [Rathayibacter sp. VKM Ac-2630]OOB91039.1 hypothetical protein B0T42_08205 [Rathayibacter sp. VKM Ac-2630]